MKPVILDNGNIRLYCGDCLDILPTLEPGSVDAVVTDPPYGMANNPDSRRFTGGTPETQARRGNGGRFREPINGDDKPFDPSPWINFPEVILWGSNHYTQRLPVGTTLVWLKRNDAAFGTFLSDAEIGWVKGGCGVYCYKDLSMKADEHNRLHPNQKPIPLMLWCLSKTGGTVFDPYMGSGTTGVACVRTGRKFIGVELDPGYFQIAVDRIQKELDNRNSPGPLMRAQERLI